MSIPSRHAIRIVILPTVNAHANNSVHFFMFRSVAGNAHRLKGYILELYSDWKCHKKAACRFLSSKAMLYSMVVEPIYS